MKTLAKLLCAGILLSVTCFGGTGAPAPSKGTNICVTNIVSTNLTAQLLPQPLSHYDLDTNGAISAVELSTVSASDAKDMQTHFLAKFDTDADGAVTSAEALTVFQAESLKWVTNILANFDVNKDGTISTNEVRRNGHRGHNGVTLDGADANKDGVVTTAELVAVATAKAQSALDDLLEDFDADKNGVISNAESLAVFQDEADDRVDELLAKFDSNKDGEISTGEISAALPKPRGGGRR